MGESGNRAGLPLEPDERNGVLGEMFGEDLDRDLATESEVPRAVDLAHAARPEWRENLVTAEERPGDEGHFDEAYTTALSGRRIALSFATASVPACRRPGA